MSYDIQLRRPRPDFTGDPTDLFFDPETDAENSLHSGVVPLAADDRTRVASVLKSALPHLVCSEGDEPVLSAADPRHPSPRWYIEQSGVNCEWNYGWPAPALAAIIEEAGRGIRALTELGFVAFDPQTGAMADLTTLQPAIGRMYAMGNRALNQALTSHEPRSRTERRPWWRFW